MREEIERKTKVGVAWTASTTFVGQAVTFGLGVVLARILVPEDFGVLAAIIIFTEVASSVVSSGIITALIQKRDIRPEHYSTALVIQIVLSIVACLLLVGISPWVGRFFGNPLTGQVLAALSTYLLLLPFHSIPTAMLRRRLDFRSLGIVEIQQQISSGVIAVTLAFLGWGVWSLVFGRLAGYLLKSFHLALAARWVPSFGFRRQASKDLLVFSAKVVAGNTLNDLAINVDYFMVGKLLGEGALGFYYRAYNLMTLPLNRITGATNQVLLSAFAEVQDDRAALKKGLLKSMCYIAFVSFPILAGLFWIAPAFIHTVYGDKWMATVAPLQIMCLAGMLLCIEPLAVSGIVAMGYVGFEAKRQLAYLLVLLVVVPVGAYWGGIVGVSWAVVVASMALLVLLQRLLWQLIAVSWGDLLRVLRPAIVACVVMSVVLALAQLALRRVVAIDSPAMLVGSVAIGAASYFAWLITARRRETDPIASEVYGELAGYAVRLRRLVFRGG